MANTLASSGEFTIPLYASTSVTKSVTGRSTGYGSLSSGADNYSEQGSGLWDSTAAITSITFTTSSGTASGSFMLYGEN